MKARRGSIIVENKKSRKAIEKRREKMRVAYLAVGCEVVAFIIIFRMRRRKSIQ
jgi:hypothetical protein